MDNISVDAHCEIINSNMRDRNAETVAIFKLFVQLFAALIGGSVIVRLNYAGRITPEIVLAADAIAGLVFFCAAGIIVENVRLWFGYRNALTRFAGADPGFNSVIAPAKFWNSVIGETFMLVVMSTAVVGFVCFNPLTFAVGAPALSVICHVPDKAPA